MRTRVVCHSRRRRCVAPRRRRRCVRLRSCAFRGDRRGVRVGGVDVFGVSPERARAKLRSAVLEPLSRPVVVRARGKRYTLTPERAGVAVDVDGSVNAALERSRDGSIVSRAWRDLRGEPVDAEIELDISYSKRAIRRLVKRVREDVDEAPVNASVDLESGDVTPEASKDGRRLLAAKLQRQVRRRLLDVGDAKTVRAGSGRQARGHDRGVGGEVPGDRDRGSRRLPAHAVQGAQAGQDLRDRRRPGRPRDAGGALPHPEQGDRSRLERSELRLGRRPGRHGVPGGVPENPLKARWLGIYAGAGIHGTDADSRSAPPHRTAASGCGSPR